MTTISDNMTIAEVLEKDPGIANILFETGMHCIGCMMASGESLEEAAYVHGVDPTALIDRINGYLAGKSPATA